MLTSDSFKCEVVREGLWRITYRANCQSKTYHEYPLTDAKLYNAVFKTEKPEMQNLRKLRELIMLHGFKVDPRRMEVVSRMIEVFTEDAIRAFFHNWDIKTEVITN